jgi:hypothetical protein
MWNLPSEIVDAAALHHEPPLGEHEHLTPMAAVHIANVLEHGLRPSEEFRVAPMINAAFLNELGLLQRLPVWRARCANLDPASSRRSHAEPAETEQPGALESTVSSRTANHLPGPTAATGTTTSEQPSEDSQETVPAARVWHGRWFYAAVAAGVLFLLALWPRTQSNLDESGPVYARARAASQAPAVVASAPSLETVPEAAPRVTPAPAVSEPAASAASVPTPALSQPAPEPIPAIAAQATVTNVPRPGLPPKESARPDFRLSCIIYTVARPAAILNGETVYVGDKVNGATVISIGQNEVTLQVNGRAQDLHLALKK